MENLDTRLIPLFESFESLNMGHYLKSPKFNSLCTVISIKDKWEQDLELFKRDNDNVVISGETTFYVEGAFKYLLNRLFIINKNYFDDVVYEVIANFISYLNEVKDFDKVFSNLKTLNFDTQRLGELRSRSL